MTRRTDPGVMLDSRLRSCIDQAESVAELLVRVTTVLPDRLVVLAAAVNGGVGEDEQDVLELLTGKAPPKPAVTEATGPVVSDPTAREAARKDGAWKDYRALKRHLGRIERETKAIVGILGSYKPRSATKKERTETAEFNDPGCGSCGRLPSPADPKVRRYEPPDGPRPTDMGGTLAKPWLLCWWCKRWVRETGRLPTVDELRMHHAGKPVRRPA